MSFKELKNLSDSQINERLVELKKELFTLRLKKATRQAIKPHLFRIHRRNVAQLLTLQSERKLTN